MSTSQEDTDADAEEMCQYAFNAAMTEGMKHCNTEEAQMQVLGKIAGLDADAIDRTEALANGPTGGRATREWVVARAKEIMDGQDDIKPLDAINQAWGEAGEQETEPEPEQEADDEEEEIVPKDEEYEESDADADDDEDA